jgi:photosystem II stability/assembly factor-like uncharacterized protein
MPRTVSIQRSSQSRVFIIEDGAGPANPPEYFGLARAGSVAWPQGDVTPLRVPSRDQYSQFDTVDRIKGQQGLPTMPLELRKTRELSEILRLVRKGCALDIQIHAGACRNPTDFNEGWELIMVLERAEATDYGTTELGALDADQEAAVQETVTFSGQDYYEIKPLVAGEVAGAEIVQEVVGVVICDSKTCGECGISSNGCEKIFAVTVSAGGSPGLPAEVVFSNDGGLTFDDTVITTLAANHDPTGLACVGTNLVVITDADGGEALHYASIADILDGDEIWAQVTSGFVADKGPRAIFSLGRTFTWIVGAGGYVYFSDDITSGVSVQNPGSATVQNLNDIHGADELNLVAVGDSNAVIFTQNGGQTWASVTGPAVGVNLTAVWMRSRTEWIVGTAGGELYYTRDSGSSWTIKGFPGSGTGVVRDIAFSSDAVGYMSHDTVAPLGRILRTIDGGFSWYVLPESATTMPSSDRINSLAACNDDKNLVFGGGLADNAVDGFLVKVS